MNQRNVLPHSQMTVSDLFEEWPQAIPVFIRHRMGCVGCSMSCFETLHDAAVIYGLSPENFLNEIHISITTGADPH
jgi:hybrid cluster-associated redox disulfide protein